MNHHPLILTVLAVFCFSSSLRAQNVVTLEIFDPTVYRIHPGMEGVLALTPEQLTKIQEAHEAWKNDEAVKTARTAFEPLKSEKSPEADEAKRAFYAAQKVARASYDAALQSILTDDQKMLIESLTVFSKQVNEETKTEKDWKTRSQKMSEIGRPRLSEVLTPAQIQILDATP